MDKMNKQQAVLLVATIGAVVASLGAYSFGEVSKTSNTEVHQHQQQATSAALYHTENGGNNAIDTAVSNSATEHEVNRIEDGKPDIFTKSKELPYGSEYNEYRTFGMPDVMPFEPFTTNDAAVNKIDLASFATQQEENPEQGFPGVGYPYPVAGGGGFWYTPTYPPVVSVIPEPNIWMLMIGGLFTFGYIIRRHKFALV